MVKKKSEKSEENLSPSSPSETTPVGKRTRAKQADQSSPAPKPRRGKATADSPAKSEGKSSSAKKEAPSTTPPLSAPTSPRQLVFAAPDPALFAAFSEAPEPAERVVRTRRRVRGEDSGEPKTPTKSRAPKAKDEQSTQPQRVRGSTRLEAKRQRRREGRDQGRRRPVVTESEFLARRESVERTMVVREKDFRTQIAVLEDGVTVEHYVANNNEASLIGNVYLGRVQNVLPSMEAAFVDIGRGRNAVLYSGEVDWEAATDESGERPKRIEAALKTGDTVLVQVTKDPVGHKGARLTSQVSLPGRYLVYVPGGGMNGISRKLPDTERARLKAILKGIVPESAGVIVRTAAEGATEEQLTGDVERLQAQWATLQAAAAAGKAPALLHSEPDLLIKIIRDVFNEDFQKIIIAGETQRQTIIDYLQSVAPDLLDRVELYEGEEDPFEHFRINESLHKALDRKVWLPSGGSLVIDRTEAMTVVDVNTGKFVGSGGNLEETVTKNNLEAAEEIVRQLRLRDIGGIIVIDFIDMVLESNRDLVLRRLLECLSRDRTKHQVAEVTSLGLVQMTRKRLGLGLLETFSETCEHCAGRGLIVHPDPVGKAKTGSPEPSSGSRRRSSEASSKTAALAPHQITDDARQAIAKIAATTVGVAATDSVPTKGRASGAKTDAAIAELEVPASRAESRGRKPRGAKQHPETAGILDAVLQALPEPPAPGTSRRRRRATTGVVTPGEQEISVTDVES
jgi:ribonuclease E